jgi:hypothetical protein
VERGWNEFAGKINKGRTVTMQACVKEHHPVFWEIAGGYMREVVERVE